MTKIDQRNLSPDVLALNPELAGANERDGKTPAQKAWATSQAKEAAEEYAQQWRSLPSEVRYARSLRRRLQGILPEFEGQRPDGYRDLTGGDEFHRIGELIAAAIERLNEVAG